MNGRAIYEFAVHAVPEAVRATATKAGIRVEDIDFLVPHQANRRIINAAAERLNMTKDQIVSNVDELGNTSAASIPLALWQAIRRKQVKPPATCCLVGFGGGLTWGAAIVKWTAVDKRDELKTSDSVSHEQVPEAAIAEQAPEAAIAEHVPEAAIAEQV